MPKARGRGGKTVASEMLPSRHARTSVTSGDAFQRSMGNYSKLTPADANGLGNATQNLNTMALPR